MRIETESRYLKLDFKNFGQYAEDIDDFKVSLESAPFPEINGSLSKTAYLKCQKLALKNWKEKNPKYRSIIDEIDYFVFHTPFSKMVEWYAAMFWQHEVFGEPPLIEDCLENPDLFQKYKEKINKARSNPKFKEFFEKKIKPGLKYNPFIGNAYTSSIFISLIAILEKIKRNQKVGLGGYGSGAGSLCLLGEATGENFKSDLKTQLKEGKELTIEEYEIWRKDLLKKLKPISSPFFGKIK
jgi:3-hydroxy-3-methylglutaryl CoA synthase